MLSKSCPNPFHISKEDYESLQQQWMSLLAVYHPFSGAERVPKIWYFVYYLRVVDLGINDTLQTKRDSQMLSEGLPNFPRASNKDCATHQQQCMSLLRAHHLITSAEIIPQILCFVCNLRADLGRNDTIMRTIRSSQMLLEAPLYFFVHPRKAMNYFSNNGYISLYYIIPFPVLRGYSSCAFCMQFQSQPR